MNIILKYLIISIKEKKFRTFLILFSISLSCALFFASNAISLTLSDMYIKRFKKYTGEADLVITANRKSPSWTFSLNKAEDYSKNVKYVIGAFQTNAFFKPNIHESLNLSLLGLKFEDIAIINPINIIEESNLLPFTGRKVIINSIFAKKFNFKIGDYIEIEKSGLKLKFKISAISLPVGPLQEDGWTNTFILPLDTLAELNYTKGRVTSAFIILENKLLKKETIESISKVFNKYAVEEAMNDGELKRQLSNITTPFMLMTTFVLFMSIFIIYTSFKVITIEKLPVIGTFRSIGAKKITTDFILLIESVIYGILGGVLGVLLGILILYIMSNIMSYDAWSKIKMAVSIKFTQFHALSAFFLAFILSIISSLVPIIQVSKLPIKDVILNKIDMEKKEKLWKQILGLSLIPIAIVIPQYSSVFIPQNSPKEITLVFDLFCMILLTTGVVLGVSTITKGFIFIFENLYSHIFGNEGILAAKNLRGNKNILNNIALLAIGISGVLMINTVSESVTKELASFYKDAKFEIWFDKWGADKNTIQSLRSIKEITNVLGIYSTQGIEVISKKSRINLLHGVDKTMLDFWSYNIKPEIIDKLGDDRFMVVAKNLKEKLKVEKDDKIVLKTPRGEKTYTIIGFFDTLRWGGNYAIIAEKYLKTDFNIKTFGEIYIKTNTNPINTINLIKEKFTRQYIWTSTIKDMEKNEIQSNSQLFTILKGFSIMTMVIGVFGILNNFVISFLKRKRHLAMFRSLGMSKIQIVKMIFIESLSGGIVGGITGMATGWFLILIVVYVLKAMDTSLAMHYSAFLFVMSLAGGIIISLIASISPASKSSNLNIIEAIKYE